MRNRIARMLLGLAVLVGGCTAYPVHDPYYGYGPDVVVAPPPPLYEYAGVPPLAGYVWIDGYWHWGGARYLWVPGRWEAPRPGYYWIPHRWGKDGDRWRQHGGRWEPDRHRPARPPPAPHVGHEDNRHPSIAPVLRPPTIREPAAERPAPPGLHGNDGKQPPAVHGKPREEQRPGSRQDAVSRPQPDDGAGMRPDQGRQRRDADEKPRNKRRESDKDR